MKKLLGILGLFIGTVAMFFGILFAPEIKSAILGNGNNGPTQDVEEPGEPTGDVVADVQNSDMLKLTKRNKISANGQTLSVSATLSPDWILDKTVTWDVSFKGTASLFATDYISLNVSSDTLTCDVSVKKAFTTQMILTCTSNSDSSVKATCTIDYVGRTIQYTRSGEWGDIIGEAYSEYKVSDLYKQTDIKNADNYTTSGGTLNGTLQNVQITSVKVDGTDVTSNQTQTLQNILVSNHGDIYSAYEELEGRFEVEITITADVYYNNTLIQSGVTGLAWGDYLFDYSAYKVTDITLSDTQLIF